MFRPTQKRPMEGPLGICPRCGEPQMWLTFFAEFLMKRRCGGCGHESKTTPPTLQKRLIYLDQWVISELANNLDPKLRNQKAGKLDPFWLDLYRQLDRLAKLHVIVCPESPLHYRESLVTPYLDVLRTLYEHLAWDVAFKEPLYIHAAQLVDAFHRVVRGNIEPDERIASRAGVTHGKINEWGELIRVRARFPLRQNEIAIERADRASADKNLGDDSERWRLQPGKSFTEWYDYHRRDLTAVVTVCFEKGWFGIYSGTCRGMAESLESKGVSQAEAAAQVSAFLRTDDASEVPYCEIASLLFAALSKKIADEGQKKNVRHNDHNDIHAIAAFLPYCDAICVDNAFADLMRKPDIAKRLAKYQTRIFSRNTRDEFMEYLKQLEADVPSDLRDTVLGVYGSGWLKPYDTILEYAREREQRTSV